MMLLVFDDEHKEHVSFLASIEINVLKEFGRISMDFLRNGMMPKVYNTAAQKLNVAFDDIKCGVEGLMYLLVESSRLKLSELDFQDSVMTLNFSEEQQNILLQMYAENHKEIRQILTTLSKSGLKSYKTLEWRFDVKLASRSLLRQTEPSVMLKLHTEKDGDCDTKLLQTDPVNLFHLTKVLDGALQEMKSSYCRRIARNIK